MARIPDLDSDFVRRQFPPIANGWAMFENAGGTYVPRHVIDRVTGYLGETQVQPGGPYAPSQLAEERISRGQRLIAAMINAEPDEVVIGPSTTANVYVLSHALAPLLAEGDEVIVTNLDHEANVGAWRRLADRGVKVLEWRLNPDSLELETDALAMMLTPRTRLVCVTACSNVLGGLTDIAEVVRLARGVDAMVCVDAVAYVPHRLPDVKALDVDFLLFSPYKVYGPHLGVLYGKRDRLLEARGQNHDFIGEDRIPLKLNPGGVNHELTAGLTGIVDYFDALYAHHFSEPANDLRTRLEKVYEAIAQYEETLSAPFVDFLKAKPAVRLLGRATADQTRRAPTFSFVVDGRPSAEIPAAVGHHKIAIRSGDFYAARCIDALGLRSQGGVIRASMVHYNTADEVGRLIAALDEAI